MKHQSLGKTVKTKLRGCLESLPFREADKVSSVG